MEEGFNSIEMKELLPELFAREKSFSKQDYYNEVVRICPELKKKWYETIPSEKEIQKIVMDYYGDGLVDGIADLGELVRNQAAVEVHRDDLRPNFLVFRSLDCFYIHLVHVFFSFSSFRIRTSSIRMTVFLFLNSRSHLSADFSTLTLSQIPE